jgi:hypothetical protein
MRFRFLCFLIVLVSSVSSPVRGQGVQNKVPSGVILIKGAWSSASDSVTPVPEGGSVANDLFSDQYFGITYPLPPGWAEKYKGPPPSDSGRYVLAQLSPGEASRGFDRASISIAAQDMFFTPVPAANPTELINYMRDHLQADYKVEVPPRQIKMADRSFTLFGYWSPVAQLHWYVVAIQIRCHTVQIVLTNSDTKLLEGLMQGMNKMKLPSQASSTGGAGGGAVPVCIKDFARDENMIARVNPVFNEHRFNPVPVRIIIDKEGKVKHIHFLSAFTDQAKAITDALGQWRFKPYRRDGQPFEVETGILFGRPPPPTAPLATVNRRF